MENYNFKPLNFELVVICINHDYCTNCPVRIGCPIRNSFYISDTAFEIGIQMAEIEVVKFFKTSENSAYEAADLFRKKRNEEILRHPTFSYI